MRKSKELPPPRIESVVPLEFSDISFRQTDAYTVKLPISKLDGTHLRDGG